MCGIVGLWSLSGNREEYKLCIRKMTDALNHRGPDSSGCWDDPDDLFFLGHTRLSILDLSFAGHQPMISNDSRYTISFNGEIYNHLDLKKEIEKQSGYVNWRGHSDTEILLELISLYGLEKAISKCTGMFALALWDRSKKCLKLARDRTGEKPLYYGFSGGNNKSFLFGSELSALKAFKYFNNNFNPSALSELINYQAISSPNSIYEGIHQLLPGNVITINYPKEEFLGKSKYWWNLITEIEKSTKNEIKSESEAKSILEKTLIESVNLQSIADVPLGTFLSGGIDSTLITALLSNQSKQRVKTFTIGFEEKGFNEAPYAKEIANHLNTDHNEIYLTSKDAQNIIPQLNNIFSEPFADPSQIPTYLVCREARNSGLKVTLSGDGGDELFGGYNRYLLGEYLWKRLSIIPWRARMLIGYFLLSLPQWFLNESSDFFLNKYRSKLDKLARRLSSVRNDEQFYYSLISQWDDPSVVFRKEFRNKKNHLLPESITTQLPIDFSNDITSKMMIYDTLNYLPNDILTKVDRASMASSLEVRTPFLNYEVCKLAWQINKNLKINSTYKNNSSKLILRKILYDYVPKDLIERPKAGFGIPLKEWLRGPLKTWAADLLSRENIMKCDYLDYEPISKLWKDHLTLRHDNSSKLWPILMWQSWLDSNK